jgi:hypothetical protein
MYGKRFARIAQGNKNVDSQIAGYLGVYAEGIFKCLLKDIPLTG